MLDILGSTAIHGNETINESTCSVSFLKNYEVPITHIVEDIPMTIEEISSKGEENVEVHNILLEENSSEVQNIEYIYDDNETM
jgi:hypothetical protein